MNTFQDEVWLEADTEWFEALNKIEYHEGFYHKYAEEN